jgi:hypothetical protein
MSNPPQPPILHFVQDDKKNSFARASVAQNIANCLHSSLSFGAERRILIF